MNIASLHYITQDLPHINHWQQAQKACEGGVKWVQLRAKTLSAEAWEEEAWRTKEICQQYQATFIINDNPALAKRVKADGVHLGKTDMSPVEARTLLGDSFIIGGTSNTLDDMLGLIATQTVQYLGLGPLRFTPTKKNLSPIVGFTGYQERLAVYLQNPLAVPVIGIGGIVLDDIPALLETGLHGVAVSSVINLAPAPASVAQAFLQALEAPQRYTNVAHLG